MSNEKWASIETEVAALRTDLEELRPHVRWVAEIRVALKIMGRVTRVVTVTIGLIGAILSVIATLIALGWF